MKNATVVNIPSSADIRLTKKGKQIVCGHIFKANDIAPGQLWSDSRYLEVIVESVSEDGWVTYSWYERGKKKVSEKDYFSFQCRYCLVVELSRERWQMVATTNREV